MEGRPEVFHLSRKWTATPDKTVSLSVISYGLEIIVKGCVASTTHEWSQIANDIDDHVVLDDNETRDATFRFVKCLFVPATLSSCPGWEALLAQLRRIGAGALSLSVKFEDCLFASEDVRESITEAFIRQTGVMSVACSDCTCVDGPVPIPRDETTTQPNCTSAAWFEEDATGELQVRLMVSIDNHREQEGNVEVTIRCAQPTNLQWQEIAAVITSNATNEGDRIVFSFVGIEFKHSARLKTFLETLTGMGVEATTGAIWRRMKIRLDACSFSDDGDEVIHTIGTMLASNKTVDTVDLENINGQQLCDMVDLITPSAELRHIQFDMPRNLEYKDSVCKRIAALTGLASVRIRQGGTDDHDFTDYVRDFRNSIVEAAFPTRGKYRDCFILPVEALPCLCDTCNLACRDWS